MSQQKLGVAVANASTDSAPAAWEQIQRAYSDTSEKSPDSATIWPRRLVSARNSSALSYQYGGSPRSAMSSRNTCMCRSPLLGWTGVRPAPGPWACQPFRQVGRCQPSDSCRRNDPIPRAGALAGDALDPLESREPKPLVDRPVGDSRCLRAPLVRLGLLRSMRYRRGVLWEKRRDQRGAPFGERTSL